MVLSGVSPMAPTVQQLVTWGANYAPLSLGPQPWRMLASNYVHIGIIHIFFNMWCLWNLGRLAERIFDRWTYLADLHRQRDRWQPGQPVVASARHWGGSFGSDLRACRRADRRALFGKTSDCEGSAEAHAEESDHLRRLQPVFRTGAGDRQLGPSGRPGNGVRLGAILAKSYSEPLESRARWRNYAMVATALLFFVGHTTI